MPGLMSRKGTFDGMLALSHVITNPVYSLIVLFYTKILHYGLSSAEAPAALLKPCNISAPET
jgi:hypothetical protein